MLVGCRLSGNAVGRQQSADDGAEGSSCSGHEYLWTVDPTPTILPMLAWAVSTSWQARSSAARRSRKAASSPRT